MIFPGVDITWREILDIALVAFVFYRIILLVQGTRAVSVIWGMVFLIAVFFAAGEFGLTTLHWLLQNFLGSFFLVVIILFQQDIRKALSQVGAGSMWRRSTIRDEDVNEIAAALAAMAAKRIGGLVVIEKNVPLGDLPDRGVPLDAHISQDLIQSIFFPDNPLHDGAVIIRNGRILAASCILPLAAGHKGKAQFGTRHRAAMGVTEDTDALALVVSEERGEITAAVAGKLTASLDEVRVRRVLKRIWER